jgi:hypothetical protein
MKKLFCLAFCMLVATAAFTPRLLADEETVSVTPIAPSIPKLGNLPTIANLEFRRHPDRLQYSILPSDTFDAVILVSNMGIKEFGPSAILEPEYEKMIISKDAECGKGSLVSSQEWVNICGVQYRIPLILTKNINDASQSNVFRSFAFLFGVKGDGTRYIYSLRKKLGIKNTDGFYMKIQLGYRDLKSPLDSVSPEHWITSDAVFIPGDAKEEADKLEKETE